MSEKKFSEATVPVECKAPDVASLSLATSCRPSLSGGHRRDAGPFRQSIKYREIVTEPVAKSSGRQCTFNSGCHQANSNMSVRAEAEASHASAQPLTHVGFRRRWKRWFHGPARPILHQKRAKVANIANVSDSPLQNLGSSFVCRRSGSEPYLWKPSHLPFKVETLTGGGLVYAERFLRARERLTFKTYSIPWTSCQLQPSLPLKVGAVLVWCALTSRHSPRWPRGMVSLSVRWEREGQPAPCRLGLGPLMHPLLYQQNSDQLQSRRHE